MLNADAGALDVPAGIAHAPRRIPLECLILKLRLREPKDKIILIALVRVLLHALADTDFEIFLVVVVKHIVFFQLRCVKIHVSSCDIGVALVKQRLDDVDILRDTVRRRFNDVRPLDIQLVAVGKESVRVEFGDLHDRLMLTLGSLEHLILAGVGIRGQMADVRDIHHALDRIAEVA